jgi:ribosomal protein S18 acetylase RimI-like enzyme
MAEIRRGTLADIDGILEVLVAAFNEAPPDPIYCMELIDRAKNWLWVVENDEGRIVAFTSSFLTVLQKAIRRWEVDLLAVHPMARGQGWAPQLLKLSGQDARQHKANLTRALVKIDNTAAQRAFNNADFHTTGQLYRLYAWEPQALEPDPISGGSVSLVEVNTLTYRGIWIEGLGANTLTEERALQYVHLAQAVAAQQGRTLVSALLPAEKPFGPLLDEAQLLGEYQWWRRP